MKLVLTAHRLILILKTFLKTLGVHSSIMMTMMIILGTVFLEIILIFTNKNIMDLINNIEIHTKSSITDIMNSTIIDIRTTIICTTITMILDILI